MVNSITGPVTQRDRNWEYEPGLDWYRENKRPEPNLREMPGSPDETTDSSSGFVTRVDGSRINVSNRSDGSDNSEWSVAMSRKKRRMVKRGQNMPPIDIKHLANLTDYAQVFAKIEQPEWRKNLLKKYGPLGIEKKGYTDFSKIFLWEWNEKELGRLYFNAERSIFFDGVHFMARAKGRPDSEKIKAFSTNLETWLTECIKMRDPKLLRDTKWRNRNMWHELIRQTQVKLL